MTKYFSALKINKKEETILEEEKKEKTKVKEAKSSNKLKIILLAVAILIVAGLILVKFFGHFLFNRVGSSFLNKFLVKDGNVQITDDGKKISYSGKEGTFSFGTEGELPEGFPNDFPIYPDAKITSSWNSSSEETVGYSLVLETSKSTEEVSNYYKQELEAKGWKITNQLTSEDTFTYTFEKGELNGLVGITVGEEEKTAISITVGKN